MPGTSFARGAGLATLGKVITTPSSMKPACALARGGRSISLASLPAICLDALDHAVALASEDWRLLYENQLFAAWFPADGGRSSLFDRVPGFDPVRLQAALALGCPHSIEVELIDGRCVTPATMRFRRLEHVTGAPVFIECREVRVARWAECRLDCY
jgi:hypothetical protein